MLLFMKNLKLITLLSLLSLASVHAFDIPYTELSQEDSTLYPLPTPHEIVKVFNPSSQRELPRDLNILIWNLYKGKNDTFQKEYERLSQNKHLILAQEMFLDFNMSTMIKASPFKYVTATSFYVGDEGIRTGVFTASRANPTGIKYLRTIVKEPAVKTPKMSLYTTYEIEGSSKKLLVANVHGINFVTNKNFTIELNRIFNVIKLHDGPVIVAGDFNTWNVERLDQLNYLALKANYKSARFSPDQRTRFNEHVLDHFIFSSEIILREAKALTGAKGSDHTALEIKISIED